MSPELKEKVQVHLKRLRNLCIPGVVLNNTAFRRIANNDGLDNDNRTRKRLYADARRRGISTSGKRYFGGLAEYPGDARALMSDTEDIRKFAEKRPGMTVTGSVNAHGPELPPVEHKNFVANDIVEQETNRVIENEKLTLSPKERRELKQKTRERITPPADGL